jgi:hypothetical protein
MNNATEVLHVTHAGERHDAQKQQLIAVEVPYLCQALSFLLWPNLARHNHGVVWI